MSKAKAIERLEGQLQQIDSLWDESIDSPALWKWDRATSATIRYVFGETSQNVKEFSNIRYSPQFASIFIETPQEAQARALQELREGLDEARKSLEDMIAEIKEFWIDEADVQVLASEMTGQQNVAINTQDVFIVHGHDAGLKEMVARLLSRLGINPIILHEQADRGRTIIEKFDDYAGVAFAIALLTPDDVGASVASQAILNKRARQNVIFELGYFVGKLGRGRTVALVKETVELPSDWQGVLYIKLDESEYWRFKLAQELRAAGLNVDLNKL